MKLRFPTCATLLAALALRGPAHGQAEPCPILARLPADTDSFAATDGRLWFELRQCNGDTITVNAYERQNTKPSLSFDTGYGYPSYLAHMRNVLVLESTGGSADHVTVIMFRKGKPVVALNRSSVGLQVVRKEDEVILTVSPKTFPGPDGKFPRVGDSVYRFKIEY